MREAQRGHSLKPGGESVISRLTGSYPPVAERIVDAAIRSSVPDALFREIMAAFPTGVTIVTAHSDDGPRGLTASAFCPVCLSPPLVLMCIDKQSTTLPAITESGGFTVNFLASEREALARLFASKADDKFKNVLWEPASIAEGGPVLRFDSAAHAVCRLQQELAAGDHWILVGE